MSRASPARARASGPTDARNASASASVSRPASSTTREATGDDARGDGRRDDRRDGGHLKMSGDEARDGRPVDPVTGMTTPARSESVWTRVSTPVRSATKLAEALVGGFFWQGDSDGEGEGAREGADDGRGARENLGRSMRRSEGAGRGMGGRNGSGNGPGMTRFGEMAGAGAARAASVGGATTTNQVADVEASDSPTPFTEIREFLRRGQLDRERTMRSTSLADTYRDVSAAKPTLTFERTPAYDAQTTPTRERAATAPGPGASVGGAPGAGSPGYASTRRSYGAAGTPSLLSSRGRTATKPTILEPPVEQAPTPTRTSLKRDREVAFMDLERERERVTTPRRLEPSSHGLGPGGLAREMDNQSYETPTGKTVTSAVTTDTAKRILHTLDKLAGARKATPMGATTSKVSLFATKRAQNAQVSSPIGSAFGKETTGPELTPTSETFVQTPKSGVSFAASPMPFISTSASGRAPTTPYPTSTNGPVEAEMETPNLKFTFGEDSNLLATGKKPKAPSGPVNSVTTKFTFGQGESSPLFPKKSTTSPQVKTTIAPPPPVLEHEKAQEEAPAPALSGKPVVNLWSAEFLAKNQEHQKKVQNAIDEEEKAADKPPAPSPFVSAAPAGDVKPSPFSFGTPAPAKSTEEGPKPAFSFGIPSSTPAKSSEPAQGAANAGFSFGSTAPAATGAAPTFSFGSTAPAKPAQAEGSKPAGGDSGLLAFLGASSSAAKTADRPASAPTFTFGAPPKSPDNVPVKAPQPEPAFTFGGSKAPESSKSKPDSSAPFSFGASGPETSGKAASATPFTFAAQKPESKPADEPKVDQKSTLSASAPAFSFGGAATADDATKGEQSSAPKPFTFGASTSKEDDKTAQGESKPFTFGTAPAADAKAEAPKSASDGFSFGAAATTPAFGAASSGATTDAEKDSKPASRPFTFGASSTPATTSASTGGFVFGASSVASAPQSSGGGFTFGAAATSKTPGTSPFGGGLSVNTKPSENVFGQAKPDEQPNTPEPMSPFDQASKSPAVGATAGSLFGGTGAASFAAPPATSAPSTNPFGGGAANPFSGGSSNPFGSGSAPSSNPFGGASSTPAFGSATTQGPAFGSASASAPAFGSSNPFGGGGASSVPQNPFGGNPAPSGGFSMGGGDAAPPGGRRPPRKFKRPQKRH